MEERIAGAYRGTEIRLETKFEIDMTRLSPLCQDILTTAFEKIGNLHS